MEWLYILACLVLLYLIFSENNKYTTVCNEIDGRCYKVVEDFHSIDEASETLAKLNIFAVKVMKHLRRKYLWNNHPNGAARDIVAFLLSNYNPDRILENAPKNDVNTSYVDGKGQEFGMCLREKVTGQNNLHSMHDLQFVALHEMAHMGNRTFGHEDDFWEVFKFILREAKEAGLHEPVDYAKYPMNYCSLVVRENPYFKPEIRDI